MQLESSVTLFDDEKVETRFAELQITADGITSEVSKKVGNDEVISRINQTAEAIKIEADKVNIEGAAIFTSGRLSQNSLDNAYDSKGAASDALDDAKDYADDAVSDAVVRQQRIYYRKSSVGAPSANTTWLASSGTGYGNWSLKIPPMKNGSTKYPYLYTAVQTQTMSQEGGTTCSCSTVLLDDTTTVIDGGTIITGTVNANAINADSGTFNTANIPNLNADKITAGDITAERMKLNSISAVNANSGTLKISAGKLDISGVITAINNNTTTTIDGDKITTGTVNASAINASSGTFSTANIPDLNASKITTGTIKVSVLPSEAKNSTYITDIDSNKGITIKPSDKSGNDYLQINSSGLQIYQGGAEVASFGASTIELGKNSISSVISLCGGKGTIERHNTLGLLISTTESNKSVTLRTPSYSRVSVNPNSIELYVDTYTYLEVNTDTDRIYMGTHTQPGEGSTSTSTGFYLGLSAYRWRQLYCWSAPNTGSDGKRKDVLGDIDFAKELIMGLEPVEFQWKDSDHIRSHMGFIAQDAAKVGKALGKNLSFYEAHYIDDSKDDYHGEEVSDEELSWGMMYDELIAPLVKVVQMQQKEIDQLKIELKHIEDVR